MHKIAQIFRHPRTRFILVIGAVLLYACAFPLLYPYLSTGTMSLSVMPVALIAWLYGFRIGVLAGVLSLLLNSILLRVSAVPTNDVLIQIGLPGTVMLTLIGGVVGWLHDLQQHLRSEIDERQKVEAELQTIFESSVIGLVLADQDGRMLRTNAALSRLLGRSKEELYQHFLDEYEYPPDTANETHQQLFDEMLNRKHAYYQREKRFVTKAGQLLPTRLTVSPGYDSAGKVQYTVGLVEDISAQQQAERALRRSEALLRAVVTNAPLIIFAFDNQGVLILLEGRTLSEVNALPQLVLGKPYTTILAERPRLISLLQQALAGTPTTTTAVYNERTFDIACIPVQDDGGTVTSVIGTAIDITEQLLQTAELSQQAHYDLLTHLPNRALFNQRLNAALAETTRTPALLFLDIDGFKQVNDTLGHDYGDQLLAAVATRLRGSVAPDDLIARMGGDEFTILLPHITRPDEATAVADQIIAALRQPFTVKEHEVLVTTSIGIAITAAEPNRESAGDLLRYADLAMYQAKADGKARYALYDPATGPAPTTRHAQAAALQRAIERGEFTLRYQPQVDLHSGQIIGVETFIFWEHPTEGLLAPAAFLPQVEGIGLMRALGHWTLTTACQELQSWVVAQPASRRFHLGLNMSLGLAQSPNLLPALTTILTRTSFPANRLCLELNEAVLMELLLAKHDPLQQLQTLGVQIAVDDFGANYANLHYLKRFPLSGLKISRAFSAGLGHDDTDEAIIEAVLYLGQRCGLQACVTGLRNAEQVTRLRALGGTIGQGSHLCAPCTSETLLELLQSNTTLPLPLPPTIAMSSEGRSAPWQTR